MVEMRIEPGIGIGPVRLGMTHTEVRAAAAGNEITGQGNKQRIPGLGLLVEYADRAGVVASIEADSGSYAKYDALYVFEAPAEAVVAALANAAGLAAADFPPGRHSYLFESLRLLLWRSTVANDEPDEDEERDEDDESGRHFQTVSLSAPGYDPEETLEYLRGRR